MAVQNSQMYYRYRLSDNITEEKRNVNGTDLSREWTTFPYEVLNLNMYIRTKDKPENFLDYEKFDRISGSVVKSSWVDFKKFFPYYSRETLASMPRKQLETICNSYNIITANYRNDFLINKIMQKQEIYKVYHDEEKARKQKELYEDVAEKTVRKVIDEKIDNSEEDLDITEDLIIELKEKVIEDLKEDSKENELKKN